MKILIELYDHRYELWNYPDWALGETKALAYNHEVIIVASEEQAMQHIPDAEVYFGWYLPKEKFEVAHNLKWVHSASADVRKQLYPSFVRLRKTYTRRNETTMMLMGIR